jgi:hypothetical protein
MTDNVGCGCDSAPILSEIMEGQKSGEIQFDLGITHQLRRTLTPALIALKFKATSVTRHHKPNMARKPADFYCLANWENFRLTHYRKQSGPHGGAVRGDLDSNQD